MAITQNQMIKLNYELKINDEIVDSNIDGDPIEFAYGTGQLIPGLESRIADMNKGDKREITVPSAEAYGEYNEELSEKVPRDHFEGIDLEIGKVLETDTDEGEVVRVTITDVTQDEVTLDYNHPLAGIDLDFTVIVQDIA